MPCSLPIRSEEHTSELQSHSHLVCRVLFRSDRKSTRLNSSHTLISYAVFCLKKKNDFQTRAEAPPAADAVFHTAGGHRARLPGQPRRPRGCRLTVLWRCGVLVFFFLSRGGPPDFLLFPLHALLRL